MEKRYIILLTTLFTAAIIQYSASGAYGQAGSDIPWLLHPGSARGAGMGMAFTAECRGIESFLWNPAGLSFMDGYNAIVYSHLLNVMDNQIGNVYYGRNFGFFGNIGFGWTLDFQEPIPATRSVGGVIVEEGDINFWNLQAWFSYATLLFPKIAIGVNAKYVHSAITGIPPSPQYPAGDYIGYTISMDIGTQFLVTEYLTLALVVRNFGPPIQYKDKYQADSQPTRIVLGSCYELLSDEVNRWIVVGDIYKSLNNLDWSFDEQREEMKQYIGTEYTYLDMVALRAGYAFEEYTETSGMTYGFGLKYSRYSIDFAQIEGSELGDKQLFTLMVTW
jgi:hypothetical protein